MKYASQKQLLLYTQEISGQVIDFPKSPRQIVYCRARVFPASSRPRDQQQDKQQGKKGHGRIPKLDQSPLQAQCSRCGRSFRLSWRTDVQQERLNGC